MAVTRTRHLQEVSAKERTVAERDAALRAAEADAEFARSEAEALIAAQKVRRMPSRRVWAASQPLAAPVQAMESAV